MSRGRWGGPGLNIQVPLSVKKPLQRPNCRARSTLSKHKTLCTCLLCKFSIISKLKVGMSHHPKWDKIHYRERGEHGSVVVRTNKAKRSSTTTQLRERENGVLKMSEWVCSTKRDHRVILVDTTTTECVRVTTSKLPSQQIRKGWGVTLKQIEQEERERDDQEVEQNEKPL